MADIMKQRCRNHLLHRARQPSRNARLVQHVLADGDRLAEIFVSATPVENIVQNGMIVVLVSSAHKAACL